MSDKTTMTPAQVKRDNFLRSIAARPSCALYYWKTLKKSGESLTVTIYMGLYYDNRFVQYFVDHADRPGAHSVIDVTNLMTVKQVKDQGYRHFGDTGGVDVWIHPSGNEIWLLSPPKTPLPPPPEDPAVTEASDYVTDYRKLLDDLKAFSEQVKAAAGTPGYSRLFQKLLDKYNDWNQQISDVKEKRFPALKDETISAENRQKVETYLQQLSQLQTKVSGLFSGDDANGHFALTAQGKDYSK